MNLGNDLPPLESEAFVELVQQRAAEVRAHARPDDGWAHVLGERFRANLREIGRELDAETAENILACLNHNLVHPTLPAGSARIAGVTLSQRELRLLAEVLMRGGG